MYEKLDLEQGTEAWLQFRKKHVMASDAPVIIGVSPWKTPYQLWQYKLDLLPQEESNYAQRRGHDMEEEARQVFNKLQGFNMKPAVVRSLNPLCPWLGASLDGLDGHEALEIKCPGAKDHELALSGIVPEKYYPQLQHIMYVLNILRIFYFSYSPESNRILQVNRDDDYCSKMLVKEKEFYDCIRELKEPEKTNRDFICREDEEWSKAVDLLLTYRKQKKAIEFLEEEAEKRLISISGGYASVGHGIKLMKTLRKGNVDYSKIPELKSLNLEAYRKKPSEYWMIREC